MCVWGGGRQAGGWCLLSFSECFEIYTVSPRHYLIICIICLDSEEMYQGNSLEYADQIRRECSDEKIVGALGLNLSNIY